MSLDRWLRLFAHVTLGLSCVALIFAEVPFLPALQVCLAPVLALLVVAWRIEGRWGLPAWGANVLGALIAAGAIAWLAGQLSDSESWLSQMPMPVALVPYLGPLLMALVLVKLFRPRGPSDFWWLQGLGLMQTALGCVLATGPAFGILLAAYLASALACLALHYRLSAVGYRLSARQLIADSRQPIADSRQRAAAGWLLSFTFRWTLGIGALALVLFLLTPRRDDSVWEPLNHFSLERKQPPRAQTGLSEGIDLNRTGAVEVDDEAALHVAASDEAGHAKLDLPADQRWRGVVLERYEEGAWRATRQMPPMPPAFPWRGQRRMPGMPPPFPWRGQRELPDFGAGQYFLTFIVQPRLSGGLVLAEPIRLGPESARLPVVSLLGPGRRGAPFFERSGTVLPMLFSTRQEHHYRQVVPAQADPARTPAEKLEEVYLERLTRQPVTGLREWTIALLRRLSAGPRRRLPNRVRAALAEPVSSFHLDKEDHEVVAHVLTDYLAASGEFTYTLELTHRDLSVDPVMDFLVNLKQGHCERYATALALMLRALDIPSRVVKGFRGAENQGAGNYLVRHSHAHAWVEVLVPRRGGSSDALDWLTLDPTPSAPAPFVSAFSLKHWLQERQRGALQIWRELIVDYNADEQAGLWNSLKSGRRLPPLLRGGLLSLAALAALVALVLIRRLIRRRREARSQSTDLLAFYARLLTLLSRHVRLRPRPNQTPREFGESVHQSLRPLPGLAALADLPPRVVELFYRVRFGGRSLSEPESQALDAHLDRLAEALRQPGRRAP